MCFERLSIKDDRLFKEYEIAFPRQDVIVDSNRNLTVLMNFFVLMISILKEQGALQRKKSSNTLSVLVYLAERMPL